MHCRKANKTKQNLSHPLLLLKHIWSLSNNHSFLWEKMFNVSSDRNETRFIMAAAEKRHVLEEDEDEEQRKSEQNDVIATQESKKMKSKHSNENQMLEVPERELFVGRRGRLWMG